MKLKRILQSKSEDNVLGIILASTIFRSQGDKKHIMVFRVLKVSSDEEIDAHALEVEHAKLKVGINVH